MQVTELAAWSKLLRFARLAASVPFLALLLTGRSQARLVPQAGVSSLEQYQQLISLAEQRIAAKDYRGAVTFLEKAVRLKPNSVPALTDLGVLSARLGDYAEAADAYEQALRFNPHSFPLLLNLGLAYFKGGEFGRAVSPLARAVALEPANFQARTLLAMSCYASKDFVRASAQFEKLVAEEPGNTTLQVMLAQSYLRSRQYQKSLNYFQQLLKRSPDSATVHILMGEADDGLDRTPEAIEEFTAARALAPAQTDVNFGLGFLYWKSHEYSKAVAAFQREIEVGGDVAKAEAYWGDVLLKEGKRSQARAFLSQAVRSLPGEWIAHCDLGILDVDAKQYAQAEHELQEAIQIDPSQFEPHYRLAQVYRAEGKIQLAKAQFDAATEIHQRAAEKLYEEVSGSAPPH
jgi:tetratricopeptide (TPR) repeat protein